MENLYIGIIGDIVNSRELRDRNHTQIKLEKTLQAINKKYSECIVSEFLITLGDEFQGLLKPTATAYRILCEITEEMYPVQIRFGLGYDKISTNLKREALAMDGPVFYLAREAVKTAHDSVGHTVVFKSGALNVHEETHINLMFQSLSVIKKLWDDSFWKIIKYLREGRTQSDIANIIGTSQPYISKLIRNAYWKEVKELEVMTIQVLGSLMTSRKENS